MTTTLKTTERIMHKLYGTETYEKSSIAKIEDILKAIKTTSYEGVEISTKSNED